MFFSIGTTVFLSHLESHAVDDVPHLLLLLRGCGCRGVVGWGQQVVDPATLGTRPVDGPVSQTAPLVRGVVQGTDSAVT